MSFKQQIQIFRGLDVQSSVLWCNVKYFDFVVLPLLRELFISCQVVKQANLHVKSAIKSFAFMILVHIIGICMHTYISVHLLRLICVLVVHQIPVLFAQYKKSMCKFNLSHMRHPQSLKPFLFVKLYSTLCIVRNCKHNR